MEALNSASLGAMGSLLRKLHELLHNEDRAPNIVQIVELVGSISTKLVKLSDVHDPPLTVNCWMTDARELSCDMENCVDQADTLSKIDEILGFKTRAEEVIERFERFKLDYVLIHPTVPNIAVNNRLGTVYREQKPTVPIGTEGPTNKLLGLLEPKGDDENEQRLKVVSILGVAGIGKSMLVHDLWWKLREGIQCCAFVQSAKKPDMRMILRSILLQIRPHQPLEVFQVPNLIHDIRKHLQDKRYFIIVDDIWAISFWDVVSRAFPDGYCGSRIITTTTVEDVALACCSYDPENIFRMKPLSDNHSRDLFISTVFGSGKGCPQQFYDVSHQITRKCGGLPLAITCIATLAASLPGTVQQWEYIQNFLYHNLRANSSSEEVLKQVLKLCFSSLPEFLKTCLLYLSVYPENYIIMKEDLAKQWTAEGFICTTDKRDNMEVAQSYFDKLVSLGLIQRIDINSKKKGRLSYTVHPVVFDFITSKSIEHNFITIIDYSQSVIQLSNKIRRLSLHFGSATYATTPANAGLSQVRSLAFMGLLNCMPSLEEFKLVRVVILHFRGDHGSPSFTLTRIRGLLLLRYLQVKCNITVELPDQIKCLKHLETLDINARVASFTSGLLHVPSLLDVRFGGKTSRTPGLVASGTVISLDDSSNSSSFIPIFLRRLELVPPTCIFSRLPEWIRHLHKLCTLQIVVRELSRNDISVLTELPTLSALSLYVWTPIARNIFFRKMEFPALDYFKFVSSALLLGFEEEAMPNLRRLKIGFNAEKGWNCSYMLPGIQNLLNLEEVVAEIGAEPGAEETDRRAAESAFMDTVRMHPCHPKLKMKRVGRVGEEYDSSEKQNWGQQKEASERDKVQCEIKNEEPFVEWAKILGEMPSDNTEKLFPRRTHRPLTQPSKQELAGQDGAGAEAGSIQTLLTLLAAGEEQAGQLGETMADGPCSRAEHYRGAARQLQCTLGKAAAVARAIEADAPGSSRGTDCSDLPRSADESSGGTTTVATEVQVRQSMCKRRIGLPRWTAKFRVPDASLEATPDDGFSWRKYGQKDIPGAKFPRGYYRCTYRTTEACAATKQVQRSNTDLCVFDVTYQGEHTCHQKQRATVAAATAHAPLEQQQDPSMQLLGMGFKRETAGLHDRDRGPASAPAASFSFPSALPFNQASQATDNPAAAAFSPPASSYFPALHPAVVDGNCYDVVYDYEAPGARMHGVESSELGEVVTEGIIAPAAVDYSSLFHHQAELDDPHVPFPSFGGPPPGPYQ